MASQEPYSLPLSLASRASLAISKPFESFSYLLASFALSFKVVIDSVEVLNHSFIVRISQLSY